MSEPGFSPLTADARALSVAQAREAIAAALRPITGGEALPLTAALGRVLADDLLAPIAVPAHDNAAMDGYAFDGTALRDDAASRFECIASVFAGRPFDGLVAASQCVRIMTGAMLPAGCDTVVPQELCRADGRQVHIEPGVLRQGDNRRRRGEDLAEGGIALPAGRLLQPADLGLAASLGIGMLTVRRRLRVALFSTGDELRAVGEALDAGSIYDSNRYSLIGALQRLGCVEVLDLGLVRDDPAALQHTLQAAMAQADVVLTSGGVSVGDADQTRALLAQLGEVAFWNVAMRPGRPFAFGPLQGPAGAPRWLFALPGNPVAALVTFYVLARDGLLQLAGAHPLPRPALQARCTQALHKRPGRTEFQRGIVSQGPDGAWQVAITGSQGAGILRSLSQANALVVLRHEQGAVAAGDWVDVWLFDGLV